MCLLVMGPNLANTRIHERAVFALQPLHMFAQALHQCGTG